MDKLMFLTDCVSSTEARISELVDLETEISAHSFIHRIAKRGSVDSDVLERLGYATWGQNCGRSPKQLFAEDFGISCHQSWYLGFPAYYVRWSAIEHVYVRADQLSAIQAMERDEQTRQKRIDELEDAWDALATSARLLEVPFQKAARKFAEKHREELLEWRIPIQLFVFSREGTTLNRFVTRWDAELLT